MTRPDVTDRPPEPARPARDDAPAGSAPVPPDPLALDPLSPIAAPDHRWFVPAHRPL
jgi:hypothetical protein